MPLPSIIPGLDSAPATPAAASLADVMPPSANATTPSAPFAAVLDKTKLAAPAPTRAAPNMPTRAAASNTPARPGAKQACTWDKKAKKTDGHSTPATGDTNTDPVSSDATAASGDNDDTASTPAPTATGLTPEQLAALGAVVFGLPAQPLVAPTPIQTTPSLPSPSADLASDAAVPTTAKEPADATPAFGASPSSIAPNFYGNARSIASGTLAAFGIKKPAAPLAVPNTSASALPTNPGTTPSDGATAPAPSVAQTLLAQGAEVIDFHATADGLKCEPAKVEAKPGSGGAELPNPAPTATLPETGRGSLPFPLRRDFSTTTTGGRNFSPKPTLADPAAPAPQPGVSAPASAAPSNNTPPPVSEPSSAIVSSGVPVLTPAKSESSTNAAPTLDDPSQQLSPAAAPTLTVPAIVTTVAAATTNPLANSVTAKIAAAGNGRANTRPSGDKSSIDQRKNSFLSVDGKAVRSDRVEVGTSVANRENTMSLNAHSASAVGDTTETILPPNSIEGITGTTAQAHAADTQAAPETTASAGSHAAQIVHEIRDIADGLWATERNSVEVRFHIGGTQQISVRVEYRDGTVNATFRTDSPELRDTLAREWQTQAQANVADNRPYQIAEPVFTAPPPSASNTQLDLSSGGGEQSRQQSSAREFESAGTPNFSFSTSRSGNSTTSVPAAPVLAARPDTARHLHVFA